jgi:hypothetical protein
MRMLLYVVLGLAVLGVAAFFFLAFLLSGGFDRWSAERVTAARGFAASEPHAAPGYVKLLIPKGWQRDTYAEIFDRRSDGDAASERGEPRKTVKFNGPDETALNLALGQYSHAGGTVFSATAVLYTRLRNAPPWTVAMGGNGQSNPYEPGWEPIAAPQGMEAFIVKGSAPQTKGVRVLVNAPAKRSRIELRTTADVYTQDQAVALAASILTSIEIDEAALDAAVKKTRENAAAKADAAKASVAAIERILGLAAPLAPGINDIGGGSFIWFDDHQLQGNIRLGAEPLNGRSPAEAAKNLKVDGQRIASIAPLADPAQPGQTAAAEIVAVFVREDSLVLYSIGLAQEIGIVSLDSAVEGRIAKTLPQDAVAIYRIGNMQIADTAVVERWFAGTLELSAAHKAGPSLWTTK